MNDIPRGRKVSKEPSLPIDSRCGIPSCEFNSENTQSALARRRGEARDRQEGRMSTSRLATLWNHPAGPKTIHFWAPTFKWGISIANIADFAKPPEKISYPQQIGTYWVSGWTDAHVVTAVTATGVIWSRYSMVITPKNWNLFAVNLAMGATGIYQLSRKIRQDYGDGSPVVEKIEA